ncbi:MAG TPA: hypothetical protein VKK79_18155 [Candidatus Lokiarchaeia archaeon]|nr:hypothetical protein [Candidatus Lokiarchaeia archaeon]
MTIEPVGKIIKKIKRRFDEDPENWQAVAGVDNLGNNDLFIGQQPRLWQIKSKPLSPFTSIAMGTSAPRRLDDDINQRIGIQSPTDFNQLFGMLVPVNKEETIIASGIENFSQKKARILKDRMKETDSDVQKELKKSVEDEFAKKHPERKNLYI